MSSSLLSLLEVSQPNSEPLWAQTWGLLSPVTAGLLESPYLEVWTGGLPWTYLIAYQNIYIDDVAQSKVLA